MEYVQHPNKDHEWIEQPSANYDLKQCPFCDIREDDAPLNFPRMIFFGDVKEAKFSYSNGFAVHCPHCYARGPVFGEDYDAEEAWNERFNRQ